MPLHVFFCGGISQKHNFFKVFLTKLLSQKISQAEARHPTGEVNLEVIKSRGAFAETCWQSPIFNFKCKHEET